jgi:hypothetical protein
MCVGPKLILHANGTRQEPAVSTKPDFVNGAFFRDSRRMWYRIDHVSSVEDTHHPVPYTVVTTTEGHVLSVEAPCELVLSLFNAALRPTRASK